MSRLHERRARGMVGAHPSEWREDGVGVLQQRSRRLCNQERFGARAPIEAERGEKTDSVTI